MKKAFKKIMTLAVVLALVFSFTVKPKRADASVAGLTAAGVAAAAGIPLSTALLGIGGLVAVGAAIYYQDDIVSVGTKMAGQLALKGLLTSDFVDEEAGTVKLNGDLVDAAAGEVYSMPKVRAVENSMVYSMFTTVNSANRTPSLAIVDMPINDSLNNTHLYKFSVTYSPVKLSYGSTFAIKVYSATGALLLEKGMGGYSATTETFDLSVSTVNMPVTVKAEQGYWDTNITGLQVKDMTVPTKEEINKTVENAPTTINDMQSYAYTNNVTNNTMTINPTQDVTGITVNDLYQTSYDNLNESILQTGILTKVLNGINGLGGSIAAAATNAATAINTKAQDLWDDAGAIWTGMSDTMTGVRADINAKMGALSDVTANGIDNIRTDIGAMMDRLSAGIDSMAASAAANMAAWGQLTLDGIDAGIGTISTGLTNIWERVGAIPGAIAAIPGDIVTSLTDLAVPTAAQTAENEENMQTTKQLFLSKFEFITVPIEQIKSLYAQRKSLHDLTVDIMGQTVYVLPIQFAGVVSGFRPIASGAAVVGTIIFIYRRVQPGDVI